MYLLNKELLYFLEVILYIMKINRNIINLIKRNDDKFKNVKFNQNEILKKEFYTSLKKYEFALTKKSAYEIALWIESNEKHLSISQRINYIKYYAGEILLVDLGSNNYDGEFSYIHPVIVINETPTKIFIVPCSSGNPRKNSHGIVYPEYAIGGIKDGFNKNTVVMLYEARFIDKNRVISKLGKTTQSFFDQICYKLFYQLSESLNFKIKSFKNL